MDFPFVQNIERKKEKIKCQYHQNVADVKTVLSLIDTGNKNWEIHINPSNNSTFTSNQIFCNQFVCDENVTFKIVCVFFLSLFLLLQFSLFFLSFFLLFCWMLPCEYVCTMKWQNNNMRTNKNYCIQREWQRTQSPFTVKVVPFFERKKLLLFHCIVDSFWL